MAQNNIVGGEGLTSNPGLVERQRNDALLEQALARAQQEREFQARYQAEQQARADAQMARQQQMAMAQQENAMRADMFNRELEQKNLDRAQQAEMAKQALGYERADKERAFDYQNRSLAQALDIAKMNAGSKAWQPASAEEAIAFERAKSGFTGGASREKEVNKNKYALADAVNTWQQAEDTKKTALDSLSRIEAGLGGKLKAGIKTIADPNSPYFEDWQKVKSAVANAQLQYASMLKGPTSDRDMMFLSEAVGNNDLMQLPRIKAALEFHAKNAQNQAKRAQEGFASAYGRESLADVLGEFGYSDVTGNRQTATQQKTGVTVEWLD